MIARTIVLALALTVGACGSDAKSTVDAAPAGPDAPTCTGAVYDPCTDPSQCMSAMCHDYTGSSLQVCTQACSASMPCPDSDGQAVACNQMGNCKPPAANACAR